MAIHLVVTRLFVTDRCRVTWLESALWWLVTAEGNKALNHCHSPFSEMHLEADLKENIWPLNLSLQLPQIGWPKESAKMTGRSFFTKVLICNSILQMDLEDILLKHSFQYKMNFSIPFIFNISGKIVLIQLIAEMLLRSFFFWIWWTNFMKICYLYGHTLGKM